MELTLEYIMIWRIYWVVFLELCIFLGSCFCRDVFFGLGVFFSFIRLESIYFLRFN